MASQKVSKMSKAAAFTELKHLMAGLLDTLHIAPEDSAAKSQQEMTLFVHRDEYLLPTQCMHCIMLFINDVAYADCLQGFVGGLTDPKNKENIIRKQHGDPSRKGNVTVGSVNHMYIQYVKPVQWCD